MGRITSTLSIEHGLAASKGVFACILIAACALLGGRWLDPVIAAIVGGALLRMAWTPGAAWQIGIDLCAHRGLEIAVALLGAMVGSEALAFLGPETLLAIACIVFAAIGLSYGLSRALGLNARMALLVACGNAICGNAAIAALAPVIGARAQDVARAITFTAALSLAVLVALPLLGRMLALSDAHYGIVAGLTVYAVPQVLAVTLPVSVPSADLATVVKLARIMMLGPILVAASFIRLPDGPTGQAPSGARPALIVPWFVIGFCVMAGARSTGLLPPTILSAIGTATSLFTLVAMAGLGLGVDLKDLRRGGTALLAATLGAFLIIMSLALVYVALGAR